MTKEELYLQNKGKTMNAGGLHAELRKNLANSGEEILSIERDTCSAGKIQLRMNSARTP